ncbi:MAG: MBL fold metallo-hydrolase [Chloroflexi bacterium]|nr:MBL fold metallo-hydrolase [Chloroflexota bacterium]
MIQSGEEHLKFLSPSELCDFHRRPEIRAKSLELTSGCRTDGERFQRIFDFVKELPYCLDDWNVPASKTLARRWGMCSGKTNLLIAMLRSVGIPARYRVFRIKPEVSLWQWVSGDEELAPRLGDAPVEQDHVDCEVWLGEWRPCDPARDSLFEQGLISLGIPLERVPIADDSGRVPYVILASFDHWAKARQERRRLRENRSEIFVRASERFWNIRYLGIDKISKKMVHMRWIGAAGIELTHKGQTILIDPYHSRPGKIELAFTPLKPKADLVKKYLDKLPGKLAAIIIGHTHFDHALDVPEFARHFDGSIIGSRSLEALMQMNGVSHRVNICSGGERVELFEGAAVTMIPSIHGLVFLGRVPYPGEIDALSKPPLKMNQYRLGTVFMPKVELGGKIFLHAGSANFLESELQGHDCDVLFMCVPGWKKVPEYTTKLLQIVKPKAIVPFHYDDFSVPLKLKTKTRNLPMLDMKLFLRQILKSAPDAEIRLLQPFESTIF